MIANNAIPAYQMKTAREWVGEGVERHMLPTAEPEALVSSLPTSGTDFDYWFSYTNPDTGETDETRGSLS